MTVDPARAGARRGVQLIAIGAVITLVNGVASNIFDWLVPPPKDDVSGSLWFIGVTAFSLVGFVQLAFYVSGMVKLSRLSQMGIATAAIVVALVTSVGFIVLPLAIPSDPFELNYGVTALVGIVGYVGSFLTVAVLSRAAEQLKGEFGAGLSSSLYGLLTVRTLLYAARKVLFMVGLRGDADLSGLNTGLGWGGRAFFYAYNLLLLVALVRLFRSTAQDQTSSL